MTFVDAKPVTPPDQDILRLNVSGGIFEVYRTTLERYPTTLLGNRFKLHKYYIPENMYYFIERHKLIFSAILYFYQSNGKFYKPTCVSSEQFKSELEFFGLNKMHDDYLAAVAEEEDGPAPPAHDDPTSIRGRLWHFFKEPTSSIPARIWAIVDIVAITLAVILFIVETMPVIQKEMQNPNRIMAMVFFLTETSCVAFFSIELVGRFICCPDKMAFMKTLMNWIDFVTIIPYFIQLLPRQDEENHSSGDGSHRTEAIVILRVLRVVRVLKLARHSKGIIIVTKTLTSSISELALLLFFWFIGVIIFGSIMYYIEFSSNPNSKFGSILEGSWWAVVTMSTVGYGDMVPESGWGKLVASVCMMFSMIIIALPVTVIVSKFTRVYAKYKDKI